MSEESQQKAVVVGVDGSPATALAVDWAVARARMTGAPLRLVSAYLADNIIAPVPVPSRRGDPVLRRRYAKKSRNRCSRRRWRRSSGWRTHAPTTGRRPSR